MAITVYGARYSTRTQRVLLVLEKLGLDYKLQSVDMQKGEHCVSSATPAESLR
jgi:glutathione S-transferase